MFRFTSRKLRFTIDRVMPLLALAGFLAGTVGLPVPRAVFTGKDRRAPFPCMNRTCGCASADQCWRGCCCFTNREKLAWAHEHGVTPPEFVTRLAARERPRPASCCAAKQAPDECDAPESGASLSVALVTAIQARKCQGQAEVALALGAVTPPPARLALHLESLVCGDSEAIANFMSGVSDSPATPPPRAQVSAPWVS